MRRRGVFHETMEKPMNDIDNQRAILEEKIANGEVIRIDAEGEKEVTAADIICDADIEVPLLPRSEQ